MSGLQSADPQVSIIIPCFNRQSFIAEAIQSALAQGDDVEVIVVDDGSTDGSPAIIKQFKQLRTVRTQNCGPSAARNRGIEISRGRYLRFLDSDDRLPPGSTAHLLRAAGELPSGHIPFGDNDMIDGQGRPMKSDLYGYPQCERGDIGLSMILSRTMQTGPGLFTRDAIVEVSGFNETLRIGEDHDLAVRLISAGYRFWHLQAPTYVVREHEGGRLSRRYGAAGYREQVRTYSAIIETVKRVPSAGAAERSSAAKAIWGLGRAAAREGWKSESVQLFDMARGLAGSSAFNAPAPVKFLYLFLPAYRTERMVELAKSLFRLN